MFDHIQPLHTKVEKVISLSTGSIILENPSGYPLRESNLYCLSQGGELIWYAEKPAPDTLFNRVRLNDDGETLSAYTTGRHACELDLKTGKLISQLGFQ
jgi:hypothetical protein